jgi:hypothetical protein
MPDADDGNMKFVSGNVRNLEEIRSRVQIWYPQCKVE